MEAVRGKNLLFCPADGDADKVFFLRRAAHTALFFTRCVVAYQTEWWRGPFRFADGQLTIELSLKLFKEPQKPREVGGGDAV